MKKTYDHPAEVLRFCAEHPDAALSIVTDVTGGTLRARGALMAVTQTDVAGYISNGCVDADVVTRMRAGVIGDFIYGEGSAFKDISLPCDGRIEIAVVQRPDRKEVVRALSDLDARMSTVLKLGDLSVNLEPRLRLRVAGRGAASLALADLAEASGLDVILQSPDPDLRPNVQHLIDPLQVPRAMDDDRTAVVFLFHDHDWEPMLLRQAVSGPAFYVGAMGSEKTHSERKNTLSDMGVTACQIDRISGPIGLIPAQRDARFLAISILAEIIEVAQSKQLL